MRLCFPKGFQSLLICSAAAVALRAGGALVLLALVPAVLVPFAPALPASSPPLLAPFVEMARRLEVPCRRLVAEPIGLAGLPVSLIEQKCYYSGSEKWINLRI